MVTHPGAVFQNSTLLDSLTVAGNLALALEAAGFTSTKKNGLQVEIKRLLQAVGLDYSRDSIKRPTQLSGGMARRASLALQLAQKKHLVVLDEPFTGLDPDAAASVALELRRLRLEHGMALVLVSHEPDLVGMVWAAGAAPPSKSSCGWRRTQ